MTTGDDEVQREHELQTFLRQDVAEIQAEYARIFTRSNEDPGTAGDEGEENWANVLRDWLPPSYSVVTKGRLLGADGRASRQLDLLVLTPSYPPRLRNKKVYLASGVAAAFECKTTLKARHIQEAAATAQQLRELTAQPIGTPSAELLGAPIFGVLAHSHSWDKAASTPRQNVDALLGAAHETATHPRGLIDLLCIADLATWHLTKTSYMGPRFFTPEQWASLAPGYGLGADGGVMSTYFRWNDDGTDAAPNPVAVLIAMLAQQLARRDPAVQPLADYFRLAGLWGSGSGAMRPWPFETVYSDQIVAKIETTSFPNGGWSDWSLMLP